MFVQVTLYAVNMCETAEPIMYTKEMVEVYLTVALRLKTLNHSYLLSSYYLRKAKFFHLLGTTQNRQFDWVCEEKLFSFVQLLPFIYALEILIEFFPFTFCLIFRRYSANMDINLYQN